MKEFASCNDDDSAMHSIYQDIKVLKSDILQYNTLVHWFAGTTDSLTKCLMFQVIVCINLQK